MFLNKIETCPELDEASEAGCESIEFNQDLVEQIQPVLRYACPVLLIIKLVLCILSVKWRKITHSFLYLSIVYQMMVKSLPGAYGINGNDEQTIYLSIFSRAVQDFLFYYTDSAVQIIFLTIAVLVWQFGVHLILF